MNNQILNIPATTFTGLANHFRNMHPEGIKGAVDVHSPDYYEGAGLYAYVEGDSDGGRVSAVWAILPTGEIATLVKNPGAVVPLDDVFGSIRQQRGKWLFALSTDKLVELYSSYGYVPVAWLQWDDAQAPASWDYNKYGRPSPAFFVHRYYLTPAECETYGAGRRMVRTYDEGFNLVLKLISRV